MPAQRQSPEDARFDGGDAAHVVLDDVRPIFAFHQLLDVVFHVELGRRRLVGFRPTQHDDPDDRQGN